MKLISLKIDSDFRSLKKGFTISFLPEDTLNGMYWQFSPYCFVGLNGSGKSNVLEALAAIFYMVECQYLEGGMRAFRYDAEENPSGFRAEKGIPEAFELEYFIPVPPKLLKETPNPGNMSWVDEVARIKIKKEIEKSPVVHWGNRNLFDREGKKQLLGGEVKQLLPKYIVGYSSGNNETLSLPFFKLRYVQYDEYKEALLDKLPYAQPEARLVYLDNQFSQAITLCNFLFQDENTLSPFKNEIGLESIEEFRIILRCDEWFDKDGNHIGIAERDNSENTNLVNLAAIHNIRTKLESCATSQYCDEDIEKGTSIQIYDFWINEETRNAFQLMFGTALDLFQAFQVLLTLNLYTTSDDLKKDIYQSNSLYVGDTVPVLAINQRIMRFDELKIRKKGVENLLYLKSLSDGEHQLLHSIGLCMLFRDTNSLFLLDEPETHLNPDWRAKYVSTLRKCLSPSFPEYDRNMRELLITSHSPFIVSDCKPEQVYMFRKRENGAIECSQPDFNTFGASINLLTMKVFGKQETIGGFANSFLEKLHKELKEGNKDVDSLRVRANALGDSVEKLLFLQELNQKFPNTNP